MTTSCRLKGIEQGRLIFENLCKALCYLLIQGSECETLAVLLNTFIGLPLPESAFRMLIIAVTSDILGSCAMVFEPPESELMRRKPRSRKTHLIDWKILLFAYGWLVPVSFNNGTPSVSTNTQYFYTEYFLQCWKVLNKSIRIQVY